MTDDKIPMWEFSVFANGRECAGHYLREPPLVEGELHGVAVSVPIHMPMDALRELVHVAHSVLRKHDLARFKLRIEVTEEPGR